MFEQIYRIIAPHNCLSCKKEGSLLCYECQQLLAVPDKCYRCGATMCSSNLCARCQPRTYIEKLFAATSYSGAAKELVYKCKFQHASDAAIPMAQCMARAIADVSSRDLLVSHLPTATSRIRMRGYDQASLVAKRVAQEMSLHHTPLLRRLGHQRQVGKRRSDRLQQMKNAYYVTHPQVVQGKSILLIDDVVTTGSSIESAAGALKQAGASHVFALVFALA